MSDYTRASILVLVAYLSMGLVGQPALATGPGCPSPTVDNIPCVKSAHRTGPIELTADYSTVLSLPLGPGKYAIAAKVWVFRSDSTAASYIVPCRLVAGADVDDAVTSLASNFEVGNPSTSDTLPMNVVHNFTSAGTARLQCRDFFTTGGAGARSMRVTALRVGTLIEVAVP